MILADGHWWPESYYLGTLQARETLWKVSMILIDFRTRLRAWIMQVLAETVHRQEMTEAQAIGVVKRAMFDNANRVYGLNLEPRWHPE